MDKQTFDQIVKQFQDEKDELGQKLKMHYLLVKKENNCFCHRFKKEASPSDIRSISKTVMTLVFGVVMKQAEIGKLPPIDEETFVYPLLKEAIPITNKNNIDKLKKIQVKHLLTHTVGYDHVLLMRDDIKDMDPYEYATYVVNYPIVHEPGTRYLYSNAGFYLLSIFLQHFLQEDLLIFIERELFNPLGIINFTWEKYGNYLAGATRLWLLPEDLLSIGQLLLNDGKIKGESLIAKHWIKKMLTISQITPEFDTPGATLRRFAYGYGIWLAKDRIYFGHGTDGQILIILPEKNTILITLAEQADMTPIETILNKVIEHV